MGYISVNFVCADNQDDNRNGGMDIKHGMMIFADYPEEVINDYAIPNQTDKGVVIWDKPDRHRNITGSRHFVLPSRRTPNETA